MENAVWDHNEMTAVNGVGNRSQGLPVEFLEMMLGGGKKTLCERPLS